MDKKIYEFRVTMTCEGCSNAVQRVLNKLKDNGVDNVDIDLGKQSVKVTSSLPSEQLLEVIKKTGKPVEYISSVNI